MTIAIVAAMPEELAPLRARLVGATRASHAGLAVERGRLAGRQVARAATGDGARNARTGAAALLAAGSDVASLIVVGVSGALSPELATADLVVASRVIDEAGQAREADAARGAATVEATGGRAGVVVSARRIADSAEEKRRLAQQAGAGPAVVDLESAAYVEAAAAVLNRSLDPGGAVNRGRVLRGLFGDPGALPQLLALRKRVGQCAEVLARAAVAALPVCAPMRGAA